MIVRTCLQNGTDRAQVLLCELHRKRAGEDRVEVRRVAAAKDDGTDVLLRKNPLDGNRRNRGRVCCGNGLECRKQFLFDTNFILEWKGHCHRPKVYLEESPSARSIDNGLVQHERMVCESGGRWLGLVEPLVRDKATGQGAVGEDLDVVFGAELGELSLGSLVEQRVLDLWGGGNSGY